jgi:hypothetical protein
MADELSANDVATALGAPIMAALGAAISWMVAGSNSVETALKTLLAVIGGICFLAFSLIYRRYVGVLGAGAESEGSPEREAYDRLRANLAGDNIPMRLYAKWLAAFLDRVDHFFGDAGMADRTLFPQAFGLKIPAPLWTAPALDRCLLLASIYPITTIFLVWAVSGHVGPAETALGLKPDISGWLRSSAAAVLGFEYFALWRFARAKGWRALLS